MMNHFFDMYVRTCITYIVVFDNTVVPVDPDNIYEHTDACMHMIADAGGLCYLVDSNGR